MDNNELLEATQTNLRDYMQLVIDLRELLHDEHQLRMSLRPPWKCTDSECVYEGQTMSSTCECFVLRERQHVKAVRSAIEEGGT